MSEEHGTANKGIKKPVSTDERPASYFLAYCYSISDSLHFQ